MLFFFFSSRRRHTRYWRDWSSGRVLFRSATADLWELLETELKYEGYVQRQTAQNAKLFRDLHRARSEERRVGKECRSRWSQYHEKKKKKKLTGIDKNYNTEQTDKSNVQ